MYKGITNQVQFPYEIGNNLQSTNHWSPSDYKRRCHDFKLHENDTRIMDSPRGYDGFDRHYEKYCLYTQNDGLEMHFNDLKNIGGIERRNDDLELRNESGNDRGSRNVDGFERCNEVFRNNEDFEQRNESGNINSFRNIDGLERRNEVFRNNEDFELRNESGNVDGFEKRYNDSRNCNGFVGRIEVFRNNEDFELRNESGNNRGSRHIDGLERYIKVFKNNEDFDLRNESGNINSFRNIDGLERRNEVFRNNEDFELRNEFGNINDFEKRYADSRNTNDFERRNGVFRKNDNFELRNESGNTNGFRNIDFQKSYDHSRNSKGFERHNEVFGNKDVLECAKEFSRDNDSFERHRYEKYKNNDSFHRFTQVSRNDDIFDRHQDVPGKNRGSGIIDGFASRNNESRNVMDTFGSYKDNEFRNMKGFDRPANEYRTRNAHSDNGNEHSQNIDSFVSVGREYWNDSGSDCGKDEFQMPIENTRNNDDPHRRYAHNKFDDLFAGRNDGDFKRRTNESRNRDADFKNNDRSNSSRNRDCLGSRENVSRDRWSASGFEMSSDGFRRNADDLNRRFDDSRNMDAEYERRNNVSKNNEICETNCKDSRNMDGDFERRGEPTEMKDDFVRRNFVSRYSDRLRRRNYDFRNNEIGTRNGVSRDRLERRNYDSRNNDFDTRKDVSNDRLERRTHDSRNNDFDTRKSVSSDRLERRNYDSRKNNFDTKKDVSSDRLERRNYDSRNNGLDTRKDVSRYTRGCYTDSRNNDGIDSYRGVSRYRTDSERRRRNDSNFDHLERSSIISGKADCFKRRNDDDRNNRNIFRKRAVDDRVPDVFVRETDDFDQSSSDNSQNVDGFKRPRIDDSGLSAEEQSQRESSCDNTTGFAPGSAKSLLERYPKGHIKNRPLRYWRKWWPRYAYIEKTIDRIDDNDDDIRQKLRYTADIPADCDKNVYRYIIQMAARKIKKCLNKITEDTYRKLADAHQVFVYRMLLQEPRFQLIIDTKWRRKARVLLYRLNDRKKLALLHQNVISKWDEFNRTVEKYKDGNKNVPFKQAHTLINDKVFIYLVSASVRELKELTTEDWPEFEEYYDSL